MVLTKKQLAEYLEFAKEFIKEKGDRVLRGWDSMAVAEVKKGGADVSTNYDVMIEREFSELISQKYPNHGFVGEELPELNRNGDLTWHIDPIDGTKFFAKGIPLWCCTVALTFQNQPLVAVVYNPVAKHMYWATRGGGSYMNGEKLTTIAGNDAGIKLLSRNEEATGHLDRNILSNLQVAWDQCYSFAQMPEDVRARVQAEINLMQTRAYRVRALGTGTLSVTWIAKGIFAAYIDTYRADSKYIDIVGPMLIAMEAGAVVKRKRIDDKNEKFIIAASNSIAEQIAETINF